MMINPYTFKELEIHDSIKKEIVHYENVEDFNFFEIGEVAWTLNEKKKICPILASIDPYDNTIFNFNQCELILKEIEVVNTFNKNIHNIKNITDLFKSIERGSYLLLMGD